VVRQTLHPLGSQVARVAVGVRSAAPRGVVVGLPWAGPAARGIRFVLAAVLDPFQQAGVGVIDALGLVWAVGGFGLVAEDAFAGFGHAFADRLRVVVGSGALQLARHDAL